MKNILVLGGAGFIASNLIEELIKIKSVKTIYSLDNYYSGSKKNHIISKKIIYLRGDTRNINLNKNLSNKSFDTVFHFAEFSRIAPSFKYFDRCWESNSSGTFEVIKYCIKKKAKLIYSASSSTTGNNKNLSPYSWTKYCNNELIKNFNKWFGLEYVIVYFYNVYGSKQIYKGHMSAVMGIFEGQYKKGEALSIVKPGNQVRDFTHVKDIISGTLLATNKTTNSEFHIGSGKNYSILEIAKAFKCKYKFVKERPGERFYSLAKNTKAKKILGYKPKHDLMNYIEEFIHSLK